MPYDRMVRVAACERGTPDWGYAQTSSLEGYPPPQRGCTVGKSRRDVLRRIPPYRRGAPSGPLLFLFWGSVCFEVQSSKRHLACAHTPTVKVYGIMTECGVSRRPADCPRTPIIFGGTLPLPTRGYHRLPPPRRRPLRRCGHSPGQPSLRRVARWRPWTHATQAGRRRVRPGHRRGDGLATRVTVSCPVSSRPRHGSRMRGIQPGVSPR